MKLRVKLRFAILILELNALYFPTSLCIIQDKKNEFVSNYHIHKYVEEVEIEFTMKEICTIESFRAVSIIGKRLCTQCRYNCGERQKYVPGEPSVQKYITRWRHSER